MKRFFFLPTEISYPLVILLIYGFIKFPLEILIPLILVITFILFIFRRGFIRIHDTNKIDGEVFLSPVHGTVESVTLNATGINYPSPCHEIRISISFWDEKGLYLPTSGEVTYLKANVGRKIHRKAHSEQFYGSVEELAHTDLNLFSRSRNLTLLRFIDCQNGKRPTIWLKSGDRGKGAACFGYYPFGGTLIVYLPHDSEVLVYEKETLVPGQSVIATLKD